MSSFSIKKLHITIVMASGTTKKYSDHAMTADIEKVGPPDKCKAKIGIYNMALADMENLTTLAFKKLEIEKNKVRVETEDNGSTAIVFEGEIISAAADFNSAPDVVFNVEAEAGHFPQLLAIPATASKGETQLSGVLSSLCGQAGYTFVDEGVTASAKDIYLTGSPIDQIKQIGKEYDVDILIDDEEVIAMPKGQPRKGEVVLINKDTGMLNYPTFTSNGINVTTIFNAAYKIGAKVKVESIVPKASGEWKITKLSHRLDTLSNGGEWVSDLELYYV